MCFLCPLKCELFHTLQRYVSGTLIIFDLSMKDKFNKLFFGDGPWNHAPFCETRFEQNTALSSLHRPAVCRWSAVCRVVQSERLSTDPDPLSPGTFPGRLRCLFVPSSQARRLIRRARRTWTVQTWMCHAGHPVHNLKLFNQTHTLHGTGILAPTLVEKGVNV